MNRLATWTLITLILTLPANRAMAQASPQAQPGGPGGPLGQAGLSLVQIPAPLASRLKLSDEQRAKLRALAKELDRQQRDAIQTRGDRQAALQALQATREKTEADAAKVLSADQLEQFRALNREFRNYQGLGRSGMALLTVEGLTDAQKAQLHALSMTTLSKRRELLQSRPGGAEGVQAILDKMVAMEADARAAVKRLLTASQVKEFDAAIAAGPGGVPPGARPGGSAGTAPPP